MPNGKEFVSPTQELQDEFNQELASINKRIEAEYWALPAAERDKPTTSLPLMKSKAKSKLIQDYQRIAGAVELEQQLEAGGIPEEARPIMEDNLHWRRQESDLIREERRLGDYVANLQKFMNNVGAPTIFTKGAEFFYNLLGRPPSPTAEGMALDYRASGLYEKAEAQYNQAVARMQEISQEKIKAITYQTMYEALPAFIQQGKVTEYEDLFTLKTETGDPITRFQEIGKDDPALKRIFNKIYSATLQLPEDADAKELDYEDIIAQLAEEPRYRGPVTLQVATVESILQTLGAQERPPALPSGLATPEEALQVYQEAGVPEDLVGELEDVESYTNQMEELWATLSANQTAIAQGLEEAKLPEMGLGDILLQTIIQPGLAALDLFGKFYHEWVAPWGGWLYRTKAEAWERWKPQYLTKREKDFLSIYREARNTEDWWHAGGEAIAKAELGFWDRLTYEWIADPFTWLGFGIMTKLATRLPLVGARFAGPAVGKFETGWLKAWDTLIFDRIKAGGRLIAKTPMQASKLFAGEDMIAVYRYLHDATLGRMPHNITPRTAVELLTEARDAVIRYPALKGARGDAGRAMLRTTQIDRSAVEGIAKNLGSEVQVTEEVLLNVSSIVNGQINKSGVGMMTKKEAAPFLLRTLGIAESKKALKRAHTEINRLLRLGVSTSDDVMSGAKNTPDLLARVFNRSQGAYLDTVTSAAAHNLEMGGRIAQSVSRIEYAVMNTWRNTIDAWVVTPAARMYLAFSAYGPFNVLEGFIKQATARQFPYNPLELLRKNKPTSVINPTARTQKLMAGLNYPLEVMTGTPRIEMAGEVPGFIGLQGMSKNLRRWRYILSGGPISRFFIDLPGRIGLHQRADYMRKMFLNFLGDDEQARFVVQQLTSKIDDATKGLSDDFLKALNLSRYELKEELLERAISGPASTRNILDDIVADRIKLEKGVKIEEAMADRVAGGRVTEVADKYTLVPEPFHDDLIQSASDGSLWRNQGRAIDQKVDDYRAGMYDYFVHSPEFYKTRLKERVDEILGMEARSREDFIGMMQELQDLQKFYTESSDDVIRAMNELEAEMSKRMKWYDFNEWRANYTVEPGGVYDGLADYARQMSDSLDELSGKLGKEVGAQPFTDPEKSSINNWLSSWIDEQKYLADWWAKRRTLEAEEIKRIRTLKGDEKKLAWDNFKLEQRKAHLERQTIQANVYKSRQIDQSNTLSEFLGVSGPTPPVIDASGRQLTKMDVATLFHGKPGDLPRSTLRMETMTLKSKQDFITEVKAQAERMSRQVNKSAAQLGWTDETIGEIYDYTLRDMYMSPEAASVMEPHLMELKALQDELWSIYRTKSLPEGMADDFQRFIGTLADDLESIPGYVTKRQGLVTGVSDDFQKAKQRSADKASKEYYKDWADYTNENATTSMMRSVYPFWCMPEDTTILTRIGWKHHSQLEIGEDVLVVDPETLTTRWEPVKDIAVFDYDDDLMVIPAKGKDIRFTPNHRWLTVTKRNEVGIKRGYQLTDGYDMIPRALPHEFVGSYLTTKDAAILGWCCTDGYVQRRNGRKPRLRIYQSLYKHLLEVEDLVGVKGHPRVHTGYSTEDSRDFAVNVPQEVSDRILGWCPDWSYLPLLVTKLDKDAAEAMWDAMFKAEGNTYYEYNGHESLSWKQNPDSPVMQAFQILSILLGKAITVNGNRVNILNNGKPYNAKEARRIRTEHYSGKVWCPVTPSGTWFANCNGSIVPTGNTYELHRWFWLPRTSIRTPGVFKGWGSYMDYTEDGYFHIPGTSLEWNMLRGTIFMGGLTRLIRKDYPEYYDMFPSATGFADWLSRYGFYPAAYINMMKLVGGTSVKGELQLGEILPAWVKTPLNAYIAAFPESGPAKVLLNTILPEPYRNYAIVQVANGICQREQKDFNGMDVWDKLDENLELTDEEQDVWTRANQNLGWMGILMEQSGILRIRTEEQLAAWEASSKLIEEVTGYSEREQLWIRRHGFRVGDYAMLDPLDQKLLGEMEAMKYHSGVYSTLMPTAWQEEDKRRREFFGAVRDKADQLQLEQQDLDRRVRLPEDAEGWINMSQWGRGRSDLRRGYAEYFEELSNSDRYRNVALEMEDVVREDGTVRKGLISRAKERGELPPVQHPAEELLNYYYSIRLEQKVDPLSGALVDDWDGYFQKIDTIIRALEQTQRDDFIQIITYNMTDLEKLRWQTSRRYFRGYNRRQAAILATQFNEEEQEQIRRWIYGSPAERDRIQEIVQEESGRKLVSLYQSKVRETGQNLRKLSPELDAWLQFFEVTDTTLTDQAAKLYEQYRDEWGIRK